MKDFDNPIDYGPITITKWINENSYQFDLRAPDPRWPSKHRWSTLDLKVVNHIVTSSSPDSSLPAKSLTIMAVGNSMDSAHSTPPVDSLTQRDEPKQMNTSPPTKTAKVVTLADSDEDEPVSSNKSPFAPVEVVDVIVNQNPANLYSPPLKGAWTKKLKFISSSASQQAASGITVPGLRAAVPKSSKEDNLRFPWAAKMDPAARNLYRATSPEYMEDGTPKVTIPSHVLLQGLENQKEYVLGISHIASGLGAPMATYKPRLDPSLMGEAKILVEVELSKAFPPRITAADKKGNISMVNVEYAWVPSICGDCGQLGHKASRCMRPNEKVNKLASKEVTTPAIESISNATVLVSPISFQTESQVVSLTTVTKIQNDTALVVEAGPNQVIYQCTRVAECHTNVEAEVVPEVISIDATETELAGSRDHVVLSEREVRNVLTENRFSHLGSSFSDGASVESDSDSVESDSSDSESRIMDQLTPSGKRILRERPVQLSIKAKEILESSVARGRGNRGCGNRGRGNRGRGNHEQS
ncbi:hypothetical protein CARUB_v10007587mg [Capsella rubella]|uniref:CCHC-type domain-containing protein n=1 Tax=Capsella rubella TaxID=81985 RepID=R0H5Z5_9BRAS|nr:hypothetical protein CARUB_v10007587mg [Capsella rubella]